MRQINILIDSRKASLGLLMLSLLLAIVAIALHSPGHVSFDTSVQLYEAYIGKSVSYHPPFMSALMKWLGGGEVATAFIVMICSLLTYISFGYVAASILRNQAILGNLKIEVWRIAICTLLLLNPVIFVYVGIVWKDVLFASVLTAATALPFAAAVLTVRRGLPLVLISVVLLAIAMQVRQQGVFMAPVLLLLPIVATVGSRNWSYKRQSLVAIALVGVFLVSLSITKSLVAHSITGAGDKSTSEGFHIVMNYDIAGIIARSKTKTESLPIAISAEQRVAISHAYSGYRGDFLALDPVASTYLSFTDKQRKQVWLSLVYGEPRAFVEHKWDAFESLLDLHGIGSCLPIHIGVAGNHDYLRLVGITEAVDARDHILYGIAYKFFDWPIYRHYFYLLMLFAAVAVVAVTRLPLRLKAMCMVTSLATGLFYLSFLPTTIACDFRYLFAGIPLITILWIVLLTGRIPRQLPTPTQKIDSRNELNE